MSFGFVGRMYSSIVGFYNEINSATLTGAIDVVIVKQEDGSYHSSPFHVRFGKLGVLRAREKIVDIEINGQPVSLHMKLGEAGEAFFVQEIDQDHEELGDLGYLATSPIESSDELLEQGMSELKARTQHQELQERLQQPVAPHHTQENDPLRKESSPKNQEDSNLGLTTDAKPLSSTVQIHLKEQKPLLTAEQKPFLKGQKRSVSAERKLSSLMEQESSTDQHPSSDDRKSEDHKQSDKKRVEENSPQQPTCSDPQSLADEKPSKTPDISPKHLSLAEQTQQDPILPLSLAPLMVAKDLKSDSSVEEDKKRKGKPRRKVLKKKKQKYSSGARPSPRSQSMPEGLVLANQDHIFEMEVTESTSEDDEMASYSLGASRSTSLDIKKAEIVSKEAESVLNERRRLHVDSFLSPFSEPEMTPSQSPIPSRPPSPKSDTELDRQHAEDKQQQILHNTSATWEWGEFPKQAANASPFLDTSSEQKTIDVSSFLERQDSEKVTTGGLLSLWSASSKQKKKKAAPASSEQPEPSKVRAEEKGMYLDDLATLEDPEITKLYLGSPRFQSIRDREREEDSESGRGASLPQSPHSVDGAIGGTVSFLESEVRHLGPVALSLCGGLSDPDPMTLDKFMRKVVTFDDLAEQPSLVLNPDLVVKIRDGYFNWTASAPMVLCEMAFNKRLPEPAVSTLVKKHMPKKPLKKKGSWWSWRTSTSADGSREEPGGAGGSALPPSTSAPTSSAIPIVKASGASDNDVNSSKVSEASCSPLASPATSPPASLHSTPRKMKRDSLSADQGGTETDTDHSEKEAAPINPTNPSNPPNPTPTANPPTPPPSPLLCPPPPATSLSDSAFSSPPLLASTGESLTVSAPIDMAPRRDSVAEDEKLEQRREKYIKALRLTSEQVAQLNLKEGRNEITFSVTTQYQGTSRCISHIYLWNYDDKIVISDIDGTITKSDVMGQILPLIGRDWSQSGVAQLFSHLSSNGYKLLYLSARAIGQSRSTKEMLKNIRQGDLLLPDGPLLLNPTSLISAFHREVIVRNPEEFKISCLKDIATLFPLSPFYAGFGNKINDVVAYRALQIPSWRIFTINPQGQLRHELSHTFLSSYSGMTDVADHFFPPIHKHNRAMSNEFSNVNYWRIDPQAVDNQDLAKLKTVTETKKNADPKKAADPKKTADPKKSPEPKKLADAKKNTSNSAVTPVPVTLDGSSDAASPVCIEVLDASAESSSSAKS